MTKIKKNRRTEPKRGKLSAKEIERRKAARGKSKQLGKGTPQNQKKKRKNDVERKSAGKKIPKSVKKKNTSHKAKDQPRSTSKRTKLSVKKVSGTLWQKNIRYGKKKAKKRVPLAGIHKGIRDFLVIAFGTAVVFLSISLFFFGTVKVQGYSMMPTLKDGDTVLIRKSKTVKRMDIILFQRGNTQQIRRVIGLPGERIEYSDDILYVDGNIIDERFIINEINEAQKNGGQYTEDFRLQDINEEQVIPEKCYLVLGDNREYGSDSREYGLIGHDQIVGVVKARIFPLNDFTSF